MKKRKLLNNMRRKRLMQGRKRLLLKLLRSKRPSKQKQQGAVVEWLAQQLILVGLMVGSRGV